MIYSPIFASLCALFSGFVCITPSSIHAKADWDPSVNSKAITACTEALASYESLCKRQPVLEILYAFAGYDNWEGVSQVYDHALKEKSPYAPTLTKTESEDVTAKIKAALNNGGLYIHRFNKTANAVKMFFSKASGKAKDIAGAPLIARPDSSVFNEDAMVGPVKITNGGGLDKNAKTVGIVYRDYKGIHFRRFESWQNIMLPIPTDLNLNNSGASFYGHQLEENGTRGLVTVTAQGGSGVVLIANDRLANAQCTAVINGSGSFENGGGLGQGIAYPWGETGVDFRIHNYYQSNLFYCNFLDTGTTLTTLHTFRWQPDNFDGVNTDYLPKPGDMNYKYSFLGRRICDANGTIQTLNGADNFDSSISSGPAAICYPTGPNAVDLWFAFDNTTFSFGMGKPNSQADIDAESTAIRLLCTRNIPYCRYLRYFGFRTPGATRLSNIESKVLNPSQKFCTPPYLNGKFLFWRNEWTTPKQGTTPTDLFSIKFKARGDTVQVAFGQKTGAERAAEAAYDTSTSYVIYVTQQQLGFYKDNGKAELPATLTAGAQFLAGTDKERAYDYWVSFANGTIQFGHGTTVGENIVAQTIDPAPLKKMSAFTFASNARSVDYTDIVCAPYQPVTVTTTTAGSTATPGAYTQWPAAQILQSPDQGAIVFGYRNTAETPEPETHSVMIGLRSKLPTADEIANQTVPDYQILLGSRNNTSHEILRQTNPVKLGKKADSSPILALDSEWHDMWILYSAGAIAYGSGSEVGSNILGSWNDQSPIGMIKYFSFTSLAPTMQIRLNSTPALEPQRTCSTQHGSTPKWATLWQFENPGQGAFSFSALASSPTGTLQVGLTSAAQSYPTYEVIINDGGKAYIRKDRLQQTNSIMTLTPEQLPIDAAKQYWIAYKDGNILLGMGINPLAAGAVILQWQDPAFDQKTTPVLSRFVFSSANSKVQYSEISTQLFDPYNTALTTASQVLFAQNAAQTEWSTDPTKVILPASNIKQLYWHPTLRCAEPGRTGISCTVQKKDTKSLKLMLGLNDAPTSPETPVLPLSSAAYTVTIADTGIIQITARNGSLLYTSPVCEPLQKLSNSEIHNIWVTLSTTPQAIVFSFGIDTPYGSSPAHTYSVQATPTQPVLILTHFGIGADNCSLQLTDIKASPFTDLTTYTTNGTLKYVWQDGWSFAEPDRGQISFTLAAAQPNTLIFAVGLSTNAAGTTQTTSQLNDASYTIGIDYTGQIYLLKTPDLVTKLGQVRYSEQGDMRKHAEILKLSSTAGAQCTITYDHGRFLVKVGTTTVWSYADTAPIEGITKFAFASHQSTGIIRAIVSQGSESLRTIEQIISSPEEALIASSSAFLTTLQTTLMERLHLKNLPYFFESIIPVISGNYELFSPQQQTQLISALRDVSAEPLLSASQKNTLATLITSLTSTLDYQSLVTSYIATAQTLFSTASGAQPLPASTASSRALYFQKLQKIAALPATETSKPGFVILLQNLVAAIPTTANLSGAEQKIVTALQTISSNEAILATSQDPDAILKTIPTIMDKNTQVDALLAFINKRYQGRLNPATAPVLLTTAQSTLTLDIIAALIDNRDELSEAAQKNCLLMLQLAKASPDLTKARTTQATKEGVARTITQLIETLNTPVPLNDRILKIQVKVAETILKPSNDIERQLFFTALVNLKKALSGITSAQTKVILDTIITPFMALNLPPEESTVLNDLKTALTQVQSQNSSFKAQIKTIQDSQEDLKTHIDALLSMLQGKGITTLFAADDFKTFMTHITYIVQSRELLEPAVVQSLVNLLKLVQLTPEFAPFASELPTLLTDATSAHTFADRISYAKEELALIIKRKSTATTPAQPDYYYNRLVAKLQLLNTAPGLKSATLFTDLEANVLNPLMSLSADPAQLAVLQALRTSLLGSKAQIIEAQKTFAYHFAAAVEQKANISMYISMLRNIIENERNGQITFSTTTTGASNQKTDAQLFLDALAEVVTQRDSLSASDISLLLTTLNYALYSKVYAAAELKKQLSELYKTASQPTPFADRAKLYATQAEAILPLLPTDPIRVAFIKNLSTLLDAPGDKSPDVLALLQTTIITPFTQGPLNDEEQAVFSALKTEVELTQSQNSSFKAQIKLLQNSTENLKDYIEGLLKMLQGKGVKTQFEANDFELFMAQIEYAVDSRELLDAAAVQTLVNLIKLTQLTPEFEPLASELTTLLTEATSAHTFADRIAYAKEEVALIIKRKNTTTSSTQPDYYYTRLVAKLQLLNTAPGIKSDLLFTDLEANVLNPLLSLSTDPAQLAVLQTLRAALLSSKAQIIEAQKTFGYHFAAAIEQKSNISMYISLLKSIIENERNGQITFGTTTAGANNQKTDAQIFIEALAEVVTQRDTLSASDITLLLTTINYALYSKVYAADELKKQLGALYETASKPTPFADRAQLYATQAAAALSLLPTDPIRITFIKNLSTLLDAPGDKSPDILALLQTTIITPFTDSPLSADEKPILDALKTLVTSMQNSTRTATYHMNVFASQPDFAAYINGLQSLLTGKGTRFTFTTDDYKTFVEHLRTITFSRELLSGGLLLAAQNLIKNTLLSAEFTAFTSDLNIFNTQIKQPFYFNDRVAALSVEARLLSGRNATADDALLQRVFTKLGLILLAPQLNTTDKEFNDLELQVLSPFSQLALNDDQKNKLEILRNQIRTQKAQILASQTTFRYHFNLAQSLKDTPDAYITSLRNIMQKQREGAITFTGTDSADLLTSLTELVNTRDELTTEQLTTVRALLSYCAYSSIYKDTPDAATLTSLYQQTTLPIPIAQLITKYSNDLGTILGLDSQQTLRLKYFTQLENLTQNTEQLTPTLVQDLTTKIITPLKEAIFNLGGKVDSREEEIMKKLDSYTSLAGRKAQSVSYLLQTADDSYINLFDYAQAVCTVMQQKGTTLTFTPDDVVKTLGALSYVATSRELLTAQQITTLQQFIAQLIWLGTFTDANQQLQSISDTLGSLSLFGDRIKNASQELKVMILSKAKPTSNRMARLIERLKIILSATGTATPADFDALQNTILAPLQRLDLSSEHKQIIADLAAKVAANKDAILSAQKTFAYNFGQAQLLQDNITNYIAALQNIITLKRQDALTFEFPDYRTFIDALLIIGDQRDAMSSADLTNLKNTVNYTYYSKGFAENQQYQKELTALYSTLSIPVTFASRIVQYAATIAKILQLDTTNLERQRFFNKLKLLPNLEGSGEINDVEKFATSILTPLQAIPLSPSEQTVVTALTNFVTTIRNQARQLSYNIKLLFAQIVLAQNDPSKNSIDILINGLNDIIVKRNGGSIVFADADYPQVVDMVKNLVDNRELFNEGQISRVQSLIRAIQFGAGFEKYKDTLDMLYKTTAIPLGFAERITKYRTALPQMNSSPTDDASKNEFINMVSSVFNAPGNRTLDMLTSLESEVLNPIKFGNFTAAQKQKIEPLSMRLAAERTKINSFAYRFTLAQSEITLDAFYKALTLILTDYTNGALTLATAEYGVFLNELEQQGALRPLSPTTQSELYSLIQMTRTAPIFATRVDLKERLNTLSTLLSTPVDPAVRANYFIQTTMSMLSKLPTDGQRNRYFALLSQFSSELSTLPAERFTETTVRTALTELQNAFNQYRLSTNATDAEKAIMNDLARQLQDVIVTLPTTAVPTVAPTPTTTTVSTTSTTPATTTPRAPTVARFYRSVPASKFAQ